MHYNCKHGLQLTKLCFPYYLKLFSTRKAVKTRCHFHLFACVATGCGEFYTCRNFPRQSLFITQTGQWVIVTDLYLYFNDSKAAAIFKIRNPEIPAEFLENPEIPDFSRKSGNSAGNSGFCKNSGFSQQIGLAIKFAFLNNMSYLHNFMVCSLLNRIE